MSITVCNKRKNNLSDDEFLKMAEDFATKNGIFYGIYDEGDRCLVEFYLYNTVTGDIDDWLELQRASDFCMFSAIKSNSEKIKLTCYRTKR